jgi:uncharacterized lipoprotein YmbA
MRQLKVAGLTWLALMLGACGSSRQVQGINGGWSAYLKNPDGTSAFTFQTTLTQGGGAAVDVTNFIFEPSPQCFVATTSETASFTSTGNSNGIAVGAFAMTVSTTFPSVQNVLTLQGTRDTSSQTPGSISGTWSLTGQSGCSDINGTFVMNQPTVDPA